MLVILLIVLFWRYILEPLVRNCNEITAPWVHVNSLSEFKGLSEFSGYVRGSGSACHIML